MCNSREFALLSLLKDTADTLDDAPQEIDTLLERQLDTLEKLADRQRRLRARLRARTGADTSSRSNRKLC